MKAKKLIEVAMPIKEISAESVRDKYIHHGHISTLHLWWARRPLPVCRAAVFASLVPDPSDENCPVAFKDAVRALLCHNSNYAVYSDIPYTAIYDPMEDTLTNRLLMFIGHFSKESQKLMKKGELSSKDTLGSGSLIKWEEKDNDKVIDIAQELIFVAYQSSLCDSLSYDELHELFKDKKRAIKNAEDSLYKFVNRHVKSSAVLELESKLMSAISDFQNHMPSVLDPFAGGGAIPLEAARLGCRSYGNDINPVAHIVERASLEFPQKYGKQIVYSGEEFNRRYGKFGEELGESYSYRDYSGNWTIPNRLMFDVEYYARIVLKKLEAEIGDLYPKDSKGRRPVAYYWARTAHCTNPSCGADVPMLKQFYLAQKSKKKVYLQPRINGNQITFSIAEGVCNEKSWINKGNVICPCCNNVITLSDLKEQSNARGLRSRLLAKIYDVGNGKEYEIPSDKDLQEIKKPEDVPTSNMQRNSGGGDTFSWGITKWEQLFSDRQLNVLLSFVKTINETIVVTDEYDKVVKTYIALWFDRVLAYSTSYSRWISQNEQLTSLFGRQAISMIYDYPELNILAESTSGALNQLDWILRYLESESHSPFCSIVKNASSGDKTQFEEKSLTAVVTDPPYYNAIAYADISDFFYMWLKLLLGQEYEINFSTPQTPKAEECTALKHHHGNNEDAAKKHFERKLTEIFDAIERQTTDIVSIMFAHQSTEAWTTLCNSILGARMNISGSWAIDTERDTRMIANAGNALESSVTVACRPSERKGFGDYRQVLKDIDKKVDEEVKSLYALGFRGADLLTACFGQAVSEFGRYKRVENAQGDEVTVAQLLDMTRVSAFNALLHGFEGDPETQFYIGWLQLNGTGDTDHDDATKFTRVGVKIEIKDVVAQQLLIKGANNMQHLASAEEHLLGRKGAGLSASDPLIDQVHRAMIAYKASERVALLKQIRECGQDKSNSFWRVLSSLKELLPACDDLQQVEGLLQNADSLIADSKQRIQKANSPELALDFN